MDARGHWLGNEWKEQSMLGVFVESFALLIVAIDPLSMLPIFASFTQGLNRNELNALCFRSSLTALVILLVFWFVGSHVLQLMGININSFYIVGGLFLMIIAYQMVFEKRQKRRKATAEKAINDVALSSLATFPLAIPLIAGPGAITTVILLSEKSSYSINSHTAGVSAICFVIILTAISLWVSGKIAEKLPVSILSALQRTFGLLLGALAIEFVIQGIRQTFNI